MFRTALILLLLSPLAGAVDCDPKSSPTEICGKLAGEVDALAGTLDGKEGVLKVARKMRDPQGCSTQLTPTWKKVLAVLPKLNLSAAEKQEVRRSLVSFLRKNLEAPQTMPEVTASLDLAQAAVDAKVVAGGEKLKSLHARGMALRDEIEKSQPQMSTQTSGVSESEKCTIGNPKADEQKKCDPLRKDLLTWLKTAK